MCAMTLATTSAKLLPVRRPETEKGAGHASRSFSFQLNPLHLMIDALAQKPQLFRQDFHAAILCFQLHLPFAILTAMAKMKSYQMQHVQPILSI